MARKRKIPRKVLDELLEGHDPSQVFSSQGLMAELKKALAERILETEIDLHLSNEEEESAGNHRNGRSEKTVLTESGEVTLSIPRDRHGRFEPKLIEKYRRRFPGFDEKVIALYARGMTTREIQGHIREIYGATISPDLVSAVTDTVHEEVTAWRSRPLESVYAVVYLDAIRVKIRDEGLVQNKAVYLAIGIRCTGEKEILGLWIEVNEGARFWLQVMTELKNRGLQDILIAVVDGLKGFPEAIEAVFPKTMIQTCIVHLVRYSMKFLSFKERRTAGHEFRRIYHAATADLALQCLDEFAASPLGRRYPGIAEAWRRKWDEVTPFFAFSPSIRRLIYTTNAIESLHSQVRRSVRVRGHFPNDRAAAKLIYLVLRNVEAKWKRPPAAWAAARSEFAVHFGDRFMVAS